MKIEVGQLANGAALHIDVARLIETRLLVNANSGAGKSWLLRRLLEQTHGKVQHLVIDPEGEFHTLREKFDYVLVARQHGDCLADPRSAGLLARRLLELGVSAILDIYELKADERKRFVRQFLEALINAPRELWHPAIVVLDEAHVFAPQTGDAESADAVKDLMTRGRKRGFAGCLATQRLSKLHKDAAAEANNVLNGRSVLDVDVKRSADLLGLGTREDYARIRSLANGRFFAIGPAFDSRELAEVQVGPVSTTHPRPGQKPTATPATRETIQRVLSQLADLPKEAAEEAKTMAELQAKVRQLERELAKKPTPETNPEELATAGKRGYERGYQRAVQEAKRAFGPLQKAVVDCAERLLKAVPAEYEWNEKALCDVIEVSEKIGQLKPTPKIAMQERVQEQRTRASEPIAKAQKALTNGNGHLGGGERKILTALAQYPEGRAKNQVAILTEYAVDGGGFNNNLSALRSKGYMEGSGDRLAITEQGLAALGSYTPLPTGRELLDHWLRKLGKAERAALEVLVEHYPGTVSKEGVAQAAGYEPSGGGFNNALSRLRTLELISGRGELKASDDLF